MALRSITALVVGASGIRMARLDRARETWQIAASGIWPVADKAPPITEEGPEGASSSAAIEPDGLTSVLQTIRQQHGALGPIILGLPTSRLLVKVLKLPVAARTDLASVVALQMDKLSPFAGDELTVAHELLAETESELTVLAVAAPSAVFIPMEAPLAAAGATVIRVDAALLGWWRALRDHESLKSTDGRRVLLVCSDNEWDLAIIDNGVPAFVRGLGVVTTAEDLAHELTFSLLNAEIEFGSTGLQEVVIIAPEQTDDRIAVLHAITGVTVRQLAPESEPLDAVGIAWRAVDNASGMDLTPARWSDHTASSVARRRFLAGMGVAMAVWVLFAGILFAGPEVSRHMVAWRDRQLTAIAGDYRGVANAKDRVKLIRAYMDRSNSLLESLRTLTSVQPQGIELTSLNYRRAESVKLTGEALDPAQIYAFKDGLEKNAPFGLCTLGAVTFDGSRRKHRFEMDVRLKTGGTP